MGILSSSNNYNNNATIAAGRFDVGNMTFAGPGADALASDERANISPSVLMMHSKTKY